VQLGDPTDRITEKPILSEGAMVYNSSVISQQIQKIYDHGLGLIRKVENEQERIVQSEGLRIVNNLDWYREQSILDFLTKVGRHARISQMLARNWY